MAASHANLFLEELRISIELRKSHALSSRILILSLRTSLSNLPPAFWKGSLQVTVKPIHTGKIRNSPKN